MDLTWFYSFVVVLVSAVRFIHVVVSVSADCKSRK